MDGAVRPRFTTHETLHIKMDSLRHQLRLESHQDFTKIVQLITGFLDCPPRGFQDF